MEEKTNDIFEIDLKSLINMFMARIKLISLIVIIFGISFFLFSRFAITPLYSTSFTMYVNSNKTVVSENISINEMNTATLLVNVYVEMIKSDNILSEVAQQTNLGYTAKDIKGMISASAVNETPIMQVKVTNANPAYAIMIANAIADIAPEKITEFMDGSSVKIIDRPKLPEYPSSPNVTKNTAIGIILGLIVSCGLVLLMEILDTRIKSEEELAKLLDIPVIGVIPEIYVDETE